MPNTLKTVKLVHNNKTNKYCWMEVQYEFLSFMDTSNNSNWVTFPECHRNENRQNAVLLQFTTFG